MLRRWMTNILPTQKFEKKAGQTSLRLKQTYLSPATCYRSRNGREVGQDTLGIVMLHSLLHLGRERDLNKAELSSPTIRSLTRICTNTPLSPPYTAGRLKLTDHTSSPHISASILEVNTDRISSVVLTGTVQAYLQVTLLFSMITKIFWQQCRG